MKKLTNEQIEALNKFIAEKIEENKLKKKKIKTILSVGTNTMKLLEKIFNEK